MAVGLQDGAGRPVEHEPGLHAGLLGEAAQGLLDGVCVGGGLLGLVKWPLALLIPLSPAYIDTIFYN